MAKAARILPFLLGVCAAFQAAPARAQEFRLTNASAGDYTVRLDYFNRPFSYRAGPGGETRVDRHESAEIRLHPKDVMEIRFLGENDGKLASPLVDALGLNLYDRDQTGRPVQLKVDRSLDPPLASSHWADDFYGRALHVPEPTAGLPLALTLVKDVFQ